MSVGTTPECDFIGGHADGFDRECHWCCVKNRRDADLWAIARALGPPPIKYPSAAEWNAFVNTYLRSEQ